MHHFLKLLRMFEIICNVSTSALLKFTIFRARRMNSALFLGQKVVWSQKITAFLPWKVYIFKIYYYFEQSRSSAWEKQNEYASAALPTHIFVKNSSVDEKIRETVFPFFHKKFELLPLQKKKKEKVSWPVKFQLWKTPIVIISCLIWILTLKIEKKILKILFEKNHKIPLKNL